MVRLLRLLTLAMGFVALQLTLLGGGPGCPMPGGSASSVGAGRMAVMAMAGVSATAAAHASEQRTGDRAHEHAPAGSRSSGAGTQACQSMAPCLFTLSVAAATVTTGVSRVRSAAIVTPARMLRSVTSAPELPPPRA